MDQNVSLVGVDGARRAESLGRVHDRVIETQLGQTFVQQRGNEGGGAIARVARGAPPRIRLAPDVELPVVARVGELVGMRGTADLAHELRDDRPHFEQVTVGVDDRVVEFSPNVGRAAGRAHESVPP